jgi:hypothetical protein
MESASQVVSASGFFAEHVQTAIEAGDGELGMVGRGSGNRHAVELRRLEHHRGVRVDADAELAGALAGGRRRVAYRDDFGTLDVGPGLQVDASRRVRVR